MCTFVDISESTLSNDIMDMVFGVAVEVSNEFTFHIAEFWIGM